MSSSVGGRLSVDEEVRRSFSEEGFSGDHYSTILIFSTPSLRLVLCTGFTVRDKRPKSRTVIDG